MRSQQKLGNYEEAIEDCSAALENEPRHAKLHNTLGLAYFELGEYDRARTHFDSAVLYAKNPGRKDQLARFHNNKVGLLSEGEFCLVLRLGQGGRNTVGEMGNGCAGMEHIFIVDPLPPFFGSLAIGRAWQSINLETRRRLGTSLMPQSKLTTVRFLFSEAARLRVWPSRASHAHFHALTHALSRSLTHSRARSRSLTLSHALSHTHALRTHSRALTRTHHRCVRRKLSGVL